MQKNKIFTVALLITLFFSCKTPVDVAYFQDTKNLEKITSPSTFSPVFKSDDILSITVSAADMDTARPFNLSQGISLPSSNEGTASSSSGSNQTPNYLIDAEGNIEFPVLGQLKVAGLTRIKLKNLLKTKLKTYINDPIISIRLQNFKITVLGEVNRPGTYSISNERLTVIEAIGLAGDLTIKGKRQNVTVVRESDTLKTYHKIDLTSKNIFNMPAYYLTQNDVVYVEPNKSQTRRSQTNDNTLSVVFSAISVVISALTLLISQ